MRFLFLIFLLLASCSKDSTGPTEDSEPYQILYHTAEGGFGNIYLYDTSTGGTRSITSSQGINAFAEKIPGKERIIFFSTDEGRAHINTMGLQGENRLRLTNTTEKDELYPVVSQNGNYVAFLLSEGSSFDKAEIAIYEISGSLIGRLQNVDNSGATVFDFSDDEGMLFFNREENGESEIFAFSLSSQTLVNISSDANSIDLYPRVVPQRGKIVYHSSGRDTLDGLYLMNYDGTEKNYLTASSNNVENLFCPAQDGESILFIRLNSVYTINIDSHEITEIFSDSEITPQRPRISRNGNKVVFNGARTGANNIDIFMINTDGSDLKNITNTEGALIEIYPRFFD